MDKWTKLTEQLPPLDVKIAAQSSNEFGLGTTASLYEFDSDMFTPEEAAMVMQNAGFIEWVRLPK